MDKPIRHREPARGKLAGQTLRISLLLPMYVPVALQSSHCAQTQTLSLILREIEKR